MVLSETLVRIHRDKYGSRTRKIWSNNFRPANTDKDLVGSGFDTSN